MCRWSSRSPPWFSSSPTASVLKFWNTLVAIDVSPCRQAMNQETPDRLDAAVRPALTSWNALDVSVPVFVS